MYSCNCQCKCSCTLWAIVISAVLGVVAAFLQISGVITVTPAFLWVSLGIAVAYLAILVGGSLLSRRTDSRSCQCTALNAILAGTLGTALFSVVLLAVGIVATSIVSAILVGLLIALLALTLTGSACLVRCLADCER